MITAPKKTVPKVNQPQLLLNKMIAKHIEQYPDTKEQLSGKVTIEALTRCLIADKLFREKATTQDGEAQSNQQQNACEELSQYMIYINSKEIKSNEYKELIESGLTTQKIKNILTSLNFDTMFSIPQGLYISDNRSVIQLSNKPNAQEKTLCIFYSEDKCEIYIKYNHELSSLVMPLPNETSQNSSTKLGNVLYTAKIILEHPRDANSNTVDDKKISYEVHDAFLYCTLDQQSKKSSNQAIRPLMEEYQKQIKEFVNFNNSSVTCVSQHQKGHEAQFITDVNLIGVTYNQPNSFAMINGYTTEKLFQKYVCDNVMEYLKNYQSGKDVSGNVSADFFRATKRAINGQPINREENAVQRDMYEAIWNVRTLHDSLKPIILYCVHQGNMSYVPSFFIDSYYGPYIQHVIQLNQQSEKHKITFIVHYDENSLTISTSLLAPFKLAFFDSKSHLLGEQQDFADVVCNLSMQFSLDSDQKVKYDLKYHDLSVHYYEEEFDHSYEEEFDDFEIVPLSLEKQQKHTIEQHKKFFTQCLVDGKNVLKDEKSFNKSIEDFDKYLTTLDELAVRNNCEGASKDEFNKINEKTQQKFQEINNLTKQATLQAPNDELNYEHKMSEAKNKKNTQIQKTSITQPHSLNNGLKK